VIICLTLILSRTLSAQCDQFNLLTTQNEVDSFLINNPDCLDGLLGTLEIDGNNIENIRGLLGIRSINTLRLEYSTKLKSLEGLDSVRYIGLFKFNGNQELEDCSALVNVDTIIHLGFTFNDSIQNLEFLQNVELVNTILLGENGYVTGIENKLKPLLMDNGFRTYPSILIFNNDFENDFGDIMGMDVDTVKLLTINNSKSFSLLGMTNIMVFGNFFIHECENFSLEGVQNAEEIINFEISSSDFSEVEPQFKFESLSSLKDFILEDNENINSLEQLFTSPPSVASYFSIQDNPDLNVITPFEWMDIPWTPQGPMNQHPGNVRIDITGNPQLETCENFLLCKALEVYPDSVKLENNGSLCYKNYLLDNCDAILSEGNVTTANDIVLYPNPSSAFVTIATDVTIDGIEWITASGREVDVVKSISDTYNTSALSSGVYFLKIRSGDEVIIKRWVKM